MIMLEILMDLLETSGKKCLLMIENYTKKIWFRVR